jgi:hypothetical protein
MSAAVAPLNDLEPAGCYDELVDLLDDVRVVRGLSFEALTELSGLAIDHAQKIMGPARVKVLSPMALDVLLPTLGVRIALVPDPEAIAAMQGKWECRDESNVRKGNWRVSRRILDRARPVILQEIAANLAAAAAAATVTSPKMGRRSRAPRLTHGQPQASTQAPPMPRSEPISRAHLRVVEPRIKNGARWGGSL